MTPAPMVMTAVVMMTMMGDDDDDRARVAEPYVDGLAVQTRRRLR
jgi:hypothetical protein